jgi:circadian clock protein KaiB
LKTQADRFRFRLYVTGNAHNSLQAIANLANLCDLHLAGCHDVEIVDLSREPERALKDEVYLTPTLVKLTPEPRSQLVGSLNNVNLLLDMLALERKS